MKCKQKWILKEMADKLCPGGGWIFLGNSLPDQCQGPNLWGLRNSAGEAPDDQTRETHAIPLLQGQIVHS